MYDKSTHPDFKAYFDSTQKRNYWILGYFGGGAIKITDAYKLAEQFAKKIGVPLDTVKMDELLKSRRYKGFKFMYSDANNQTPQMNASVMENVFEHLTD